MRILYVEDHHDTAHALKKLLGLQGYFIDLAYSAAEARALHSHSPYDMLLIDLGLPDEHGGSLLRTLKRMADAKSIAFTGYAFPGDADEAREDGFDAFVAKPATFDQVLAAIHNVAGTVAAPGSGPISLKPDLRPASNVDAHAASPALGG